MSIVGTIGTSTDRWSEHKNSTIGPFHWGGNVFALISRTTGTGGVGWNLHRSTNGGVDWTSVVFGPSGSGTVFGPAVAAVQVGQYVYTSSSYAGNGHHGQVIDLSALTSSTTGLGGTSPQPNISGSYPYYLAVRTAGATAATSNFVVFHQGATVSSMGTAYRRLAYSVWNGSSWTTTQLPEMGGVATAHNDARAAVIDSAGRVAFVATRQGASSPGLYSRTLRADNTLSVGWGSLATSSAGADHNYAAGLPTLAFGDAFVPAVPADANSLNAVRITQSDLGNPSTSVETAVTAPINVTTSNPASFAADGDIVHSLHVRTNGSLWRRERAANGTWGTEADVLQRPSIDITASTVSTNRFAVPRTAGNRFAQSFTVTETMTVGSGAGVAVSSDQGVSSISETLDGTSLVTLTYTGFANNRSQWSCSPVTLTPGTYFIRAEITPTAAGDIIIRHSDAPYSGGSFFINTGSGWVDQNQDAGFALFPALVLAISSNVYTRSGSKVIGYVVDDGGTLKYGEVPLVGPPGLTTGATTNLASTSFTQAGNITSTGGFNVTTRGICYMIGTTGDPTTANLTNFETGSFGTGSYTRNLTGLTPGTSYRVRAYAINSAGTGYGPTITVTTAAAKLATLVDDFTGDFSKWSDSLGAVHEPSNGRVRIPLAWNWYYLRSVNYYDLHNSEVVFEVSIDQIDSSKYGFSIALSTLGSLSSIRIEYYTAQGVPYFSVSEYAQGSYNYNEGEGPVDRSDVRFIRLSETSGTLSLETSASGGAWTLRHSWSRVGVFENVRLQLSGGDDDNLVTADSLGNVYVHGVNVLPSGAEPKNGTDAAQASVTETATVTVVAVATDAAQAATTEAQTLAVAVAQTDAAQAAATEAQALTVALTATDEAQAAAAEDGVAGASETNVPAADTAEAAVTEAETLAVAFTETDLTEALVAEAASLAVALTATDTAEASTAEAPTPFLASALVDLAEALTVELATVEAHGVTGLTVEPEGQGLRADWSSDGAEFVVRRERWVGEGAPV